jgi:predicted Zn-ribbon and HTH transcriptional regulator
MTQTTARDSLTAQYSSILDIGETVIKHTSQKHNQRLILTNLSLLTVREPGPLSNNYQVLSGIPLDSIHGDIILKFGGFLRPDTLVISTEIRGRSDTHRFELPKSSRGKEWADYIGTIRDGIADRKSRIIKLLDSQEKTSFSEIAQIDPNLIDKGRCAQYIQGLNDEGSVKGFIEKEKEQFVHITAQKQKTEIVHNNIAVDFSIRNGALEIKCPHCGSPNSPRERINPTKCVHCQNEYIIPDKILNLL